MVPAAPTVQVAVAVTKLPPSGGGEKVSVGTAVYPTPILVKSIELTVPVSETIAVAIPGNLSSCSAILIKSCKVSLLADCSLY